MKRESRRYLGVELAGAKNQKTAVAVLEWYAKGEKIFLLDIHDRLTHVPRGSGEGTHHAHLHHPGDEALLELIDELNEGIARTGVNTALDLPPAIGKSARAAASEIQWMREITRKATRSKLKALEFTPYTQRPVELWIRYHIMPELEPHERFEIDETLGGNRAPLTARMHYLQRYLKGMNLTEVWPKLSVAVLAASLGLSKRTIQCYRHLEEGVHAREEILERLTEKEEVFIYERDVRKLSSNLASFDAFICAYTALLADLGRTEKKPKGYPASAGWVHCPSISGTK
ncbi:MAG: DUF429 domain-containing protein [Oligoflexia bacterium]|nr:DUF429 domain-containing protein [Oligoflexia bacterium]